MRHNRGMSRATTLLVAYGALTAAHLVGHLTGTTWLAEFATKPLLLPLLGLYLLAAVPGSGDRVKTATLVAIGLSWLGDVLLTLDGQTDAGGDLLFIGGLVSFLSAHVAYIVALTAIVRGRGGRPPIWALIWVPYVALMIGFLAPDLGEMLVPVAIYAMTIGLMAIIAAGVNIWTTLGAALFVASDSILAIRKFSESIEFSEPLGIFMLMLTYTLGQALLVYGIAAAINARATQAAAETS